MLYRLPTHTPPLAAILESIGQPSNEALAKALDVTPRTVRRWRADDEAPRAALLALYWVTPWGASQLDADAYNSATLHAGLARAKSDECTELRAELARVLALADTGAANAPSLRVLPLAPVYPIRPSPRPWPQRSS